MKNKLLSVIGLKMKWRGSKVFIKSMKASQILEASDNAVVTRGRTSRV